MPYEISNIEREHAQIMEQMAQMCRTNRDGFTETARLNVIEELLQNSPYHLISEGSFHKMYSKVPLEELPDACILVSTHVDTVNSINTCHSTLDEETGIYTGTYDNLSTNAASVILMREENLPDNVIFAFTGDEETGRCMGAREAAATLVQAGKHPYCIALDVTYEGFYDNYLISVENLVGSPDETMEESALAKIGSILMDLEPSGTQTFQLVKKSPTHVPATLPSNYIARNSGMMDEAFIYHDLGLPSMSLCVPCGAGGMHSQSGVKIKSPIFEGYLLSLTGILDKMAEQARNIIYNTNHSVMKLHRGTVEAYKIARENAIISATGIHITQPQKYSCSAPTYHTSRTIPPSYLTEEELEEFSMDILTQEDINELYEELGVHEDGDSFVMYGYLPSAIYEILEIDPNEEFTEEEIKKIESTKRSIWNQYEKEVYEYNRRLAFQSNSGWSEFLIHEDAEYEE